MLGEKIVLLVYLAVGWLPAHQWMALHPCMMRALIGLSQLLRKEENVNLEGRCICGFKGIGGWKYGVNMTVFHCGHLETSQRTNYKIK